MLVSANAKIRSNKWQISKPVTCLTCLKYCLPHASSLTCLPQFIFNVPALSQAPFLGADSLPGEVKLRLGTPETLINKALLYNDSKLTTHEILKGKEFP